MSQTAVVWITGANRGIGAAVARHFVSEGLRVVLFVRNQAQVVATKSLYEPEAADRIEVYASDLTNVQSIESAITQARSVFGDPDILINNAGMNVRGTLEPTVSDFEGMLRVNLLAPFLFCRAVVPAMKQRSTGLIISIGSVCSKIGFGGSGLYCATKFALLGFTQSLFQELTPLGIKVTAICPSWVDTDMASYASHDRSQMIRPSDIVATIEYVRRLSAHACPVEVVIENTV